MLHVHITVWIHFSQKHSQVNLEFWEFRVREFRVNWENILSLLVKLMNPGLGAQIYANFQVEVNAEKHQFSWTCKQMNDLNHVNVPAGINKLACVIATKHTSINAPAEKWKVILQEAPYIMKFRIKVQKWKIRKKIKWQQSSTFYTHSNSVCEWCKKRNIWRFLSGQGRHGCSTLFLEINSE